MKNNMLTSLVVLASLLFSQVQADVQFSGYGSIVAGKVLDGEIDPSGEREFQVDFYDYAFYDEEIRYKPETMFALQARADVLDNLTFTAQLVAKGTDEFDPDLDWLYFTYNLTDESYLMAGRRNLPMYYFSEYLEVGYAYPWVRPPANLYWWEITQFNGITYGKNFEVGDWSMTLNLFAGREDREDIRAHDYWRNRGGYYVQPEAYDDPPGIYVLGSADVTWSDILGATLSFSNDFADMRISYFTTHYETYADIFYRDPIDIDNDGNIDFYSERRTNPDGTPIRSTSFGATEFDLTFFGLSGSFNFELATLMFDYNFVAYDDAYGFEFPTYLITAIYNHDTWQPYIGYTKAAGTITEDFGGFGIGDAEEHQMITIGLRYNFHSNASLKIQYDDFEDQGNRPEWFDFSYHNDAELLSVGVDFFF